MCLLERLPKRLLCNARRRVILTVMRQFRAIVGMCLAVAAVAAPGSAQSREKVDLELVLAVDISVSMSRDELEIQRDGYAAALTDPEVVSAITSGPYGRISLAYFEWAGVTSQKLIVPWTMIGDGEDAAAFAAKLDRIPAWQPRRTSISGAIDFGVDLLSQSPYQAGRRVIDISGDGSNNEGRPVTVARDEAVADGIVINGLPVMADKVNFSGNDVAHLDVYYQNCVVGGPGSFVIAINAWAEFPAAIRRKLLLEIARRPPAQPARPRVVLAQATAPFDCLVGERLYRDDPFRNKFSPEKFQWPSNRPENWPKQ